jgi:hypothetical protein
MKVLKAVGISPTERRRQGLSGDDVVLFVGKKV